MLALRRERGEFPDRIGEREQMLFADVQAQDARERRVRARVRMLLAQDALGLRTGCGTA